MESFEQFWALYPRKVAKAVARKAWARMTAQQHESALDALPNHIAYWKLKETSTEFIPHCSTFLNQERWEDELDMTVKEMKKPTLPWYSTDELTLAKCRELGLTPYAGESFAQLRQRISSQVNRQATA